MESIKQALVPFEKMTDLLSGESYVTVSYIIPLIHHLIDVCSPSSNLSLLTNKIRENVLGYILTRYIKNWLMYEFYFLLHKINRFIYFDFIISRLHYRHLLEIFKNTRN